MQGKRCLHPCTPHAQSLPLRTTILCFKCYTLAELKWVFGRSIQAYQPLVIKVGADTTQKMTSSTNATRSPLPLAPRKSDNRPVYESPIFDYTWATDLEDYEKQREALLAYYKNDVVKATTFMDLHTEWRLLEQYRYWAYEEASMTANDMDEEKVGFFDTLEKELNLDRTVVFREFWTLGIRLVMEKGKWVVRDNDKIKRDKYAEVKQERGRDDAQRPRNSSLEHSTAVFDRITARKSATALKNMQALHSSSIEPRPQPQPSLLAIETTPLLSTTHPSSDSTHDTDSGLSTIICGCPCS